jgi:hypothetical protein
MQRRHALPQQTGKNHPTKFPNLLVTRLDANRPGAPLNIAIETASGKRTRFNHNLNY